MPGMKTEIMVKNTEEKKEEEDPEITIEENFASNGTVAIVGSMMPTVPSFTKTLLIVFMRIDVTRKISVDFSMQIWYTQIQSQIF